MTIEELSSWRVAAIEGKVPCPARSDRWQPQRAGLVNPWEYDRLLTSTTGKCRAHTSRGPYAGAHRSD